LFNAIAEAYRNGIPFTLAKTSAHVQLNFRILMEKGTLSHIIERDRRVRTCLGIPMDAKRVAVTLEQVQNVFCEGLRIVERILSQKMDEIGRQEWADRKNAVCIVPTSHEGEHANPPVARTGKRITFLACIAPDGSFLRRTVIVPRITVAVDLVLTDMTS
jgi:hypothetical protein